MITPENLVAELTNIVSELSIIESKLLSLDPESPGLLEEIEEIESETAETIIELPNIIQMIVDTKPDPGVIGTKLKDSFDKVSAILGQLTEYRNGLKNKK